MMPLNEKCFWSKCKRQPEPDLYINTCYGKRYYCKSHWRIVSLDIKRPSSFSRLSEIGVDYLLRKSERYNGLSGRKD